MQQRESLQHHAQTYGQEFEELLDYYAKRGSCFEWEYQKSEYCRVQYARFDGTLILCLDHIKYDGDWQPQFIPLYMVIEQDGEESHFHHTLAKDQVPYLPFTTPEMTLRSVLGTVQEIVRNRRSIR